MRIHAASQVLRRAPGASRAAGFTLVEVLVAFAITAVVLAAVGGVLVGILHTQRKVEATLLRERIGSAILDIIARDVQGVYVYDLPGTFKGTDERTGGGDADSFEFVTTSDPAVRGAPEESGEGEGTSTGRRSGVLASDETTDERFSREPPQLTKVGYVVRDSSSHRGLLTLFRSEVVYIPPAKTASTASSWNEAVAAATASSTEDEDTARFMEVYDRVKSFNVRYLLEDPENDTKEWKDAWEETDKTPTAVEITLEIVPDPKAQEGQGEDRARKIYSTMVALPAVQPPASQASTQQQGTTPASGGTGTGTTGQ